MKRSFRSLALASAWLCAALAAPAFAAQTTTPDSAPAATDAASAAALDNSQIEIFYSEPNASYLRRIYDRLRKRQFLEQLKQFLSPLNLPAGVTLRLTTKECGETNSWWSGRQDGLFLCYEWLDFAIRVAPKGTTPEGATWEDAILGAFLQVTFHELGHAMFDIYDIPVFGREEDAADQMAGFILSEFGEETARRTLPGTVYIWQALAASDGEWRRDAFSDIHGYPLQRAYNYLCMAYGGNPEAFRYFVDKGLLPKERAELCGREFTQIQHAFAVTLYPHIDKAKMRIVQSRQWLLPEGSEAPGP